MKDNLEAFNERGISVPVILGGAALTPKPKQSVARLTVVKTLNFDFISDPESKLKGLLSGGGTSRSSQQSDGSVQVL